MVADAQIIFRGKTADEMTTEDIERALEYADRTIKKLRAEVLALRFASTGAAR